MADACEESSSDCSDSISGDNSSFYTESSSSEEDLQCEEPCTSSSSVEKRKSRREKSNSSSKRSSKKKSAKQKKQASNTLDEDQLEELTSWIFSTQKASEIEGIVRSKLLESPRVKSTKERERFAKSLLCESQKTNFQLLILGFCRKFSTLVSECALSTDKANKKAVFSVAWMKMLGNFQVGKATQERIIMERFLVGLQSESQVSPEVAHAVLSVIHEMVYSTICSHMRQKKSQPTELRHSCLAVESDDTLFRYCGAALHRMVKLRKETLQQKKGCGKVSSKRRPVVEKELELLAMLVMKDKSDISQSLKNLDEGNLVFPRMELLPFLKEVDSNVREFATDINLAKYPTKFIDVCQTSVLNNEKLEIDFKLFVASFTSAEDAINDGVISGVFKALVSKLANTRINEFLNAKVERDLRVTKSCRCR